VPGHGHNLAAERRYVGEIRPIAARIYAAVSPAQDVVDHVAEPRYGDSFSARDALAHGDALTLLRSARHALMRLNPPSALATEQRQMVAGTDRIVAALTRLRGLSKNESSDHLMAVINGVGSTQLSNAEARYDDGIREAFRAVHRKAPRDFQGVSLPAPASRTGWIFSADRSCDAAQLHLAGLAKYQNTHTPSAGESIDALWTRVLTKTERTLVSLPRPRRASALPRTLRTRLRVLTYTAKLFTDARAGIRDRNVPAVVRAASEVRAAEPSLRVLGRAMRQYGAVSCGGIVEMWGGKHVATSSSGGRPSLNT
jgi:hypothetical protein